MRSLIAKKTKVFAAGPIAAGVLAGIALMYFADPVSGRLRRRRVYDKAVHLSRLARVGAGKSRRDLAHRSAGIVAMARGKLRGRDEAPDEILVERVRSTMGTVVSHCHSIEVAADAGVVTLSGPILKREAERLLRATRRVRGVRGIVDHLQRHPTGEGISALQGGVPRRRRFELLQQSWAPGPRLLVGLTGGSLVAVAVGLPGLAASFTAVFGSALLVRALSNLPIKRLIGVGSEPSGIEFQKAIHIAAPADELFAMFRNFENLPRFMAHLASVHVDGERSHWTAIGPAGIRVSWDAEITRMEENRLIAWRSVPGSSVRTAGVARFEPDSRGGTLLSIRMSYNPPVGALGHVVAVMFGADPKKAMDDDLLRLSSLLETGSATAHGERVTREELSPQAPSGRLESVPASEPICPPTPREEAEQILRGAQN